MDAELALAVTMTRNEERINDLEDRLKVANDAIEHYKQVIRLADKRICELEQQNWELTQKGTI
jgi:prefoldin subunit 5